MNQDVNHMSTEYYDSSYKQQEVTYNTYDSEPMQNQVESAPEV